MTPDENFAFINTFWAHGAGHPYPHNGFIDKHIGDAIMALFNNADDAPAPASRCTTRSRASTPSACVRPRADRHRRRPQHRLADAGHDRREASHGRHGDLRRRQPPFADQSLTKEYHVGLLISRYTYEQLADPKATISGRSTSWWSKGKTLPVTTSRCTRPTARPARRQGPDAGLCCSPASTRSPSTARGRPPLPAMPRWRPRRAAVNPLKSCAQSPLPK